MICKERYIKKSSLALLVLFQGNPKLCGPQIKKTCSTGGDGHKETINKIGSGIDDPNSNSCVCRECSKLIE
ncbi:hypothetical protein EJ110_NYTH20584 [Nymphaea thermarum]|nr:hypothetical protein EJ110_NYTH20584 [Nymphaea thermarum]